MEEETLVLIKPDAMVKNIYGSILNELSNLNLKMVGLKLVKVNKELAGKHYSEHKEKYFFENLLKYITGEFHNNENVLAIVYQGENAIKKIREFAGSTDPEDAHPTSIRGKYGRNRKKIDCKENVLHASDSIESAKREINLWFSDGELIK